MAIDVRKRLSRFIDQNGTQAEFAREVACSESHLSLVLSGRRGISLALAGRLAARTGIPLEAFAEAAQ